MGNNQNESPDINLRIMQKLKDYQPDVSELAIKAIQLSEHLNEPSVVDALHGHIREIVRRQTGGES